MDRLEKFEFILDQMRLCLASEDYIRCKLISQKVGARALSDKDFQVWKNIFSFFLLFYSVSEHDCVQSCLDLFSQRNIFVWVDYFD